MPSGTRWARAPCARRGRRWGRCSRRRPGRSYPHNHDPAKSLVHVEDHLAQLCVHVGRLKHQGDVYQQWVFFDDRWAAAHPDLANSILRYTRCWDMLSADGPCDVG